MYGNMSAPKVFIMSIVLGLALTAVLALISVVLNNIFNAGDGDDDKLEKEHRENIDFIFERINKDSDEMIERLEQQLKGMRREIIETEKATAIIKRTVLDGLKIRSEAPTRLKSPPKLRLVKQKDDYEK